LLPVRLANMPGPPSHYDHFQPMPVHGGQQAGYVVVRLSPHDKLFKIEGGNPLQ